MAGPISRRLVIVVQSATCADDAGRAAFHEHTDRIGGGIIPLEESWFYAKNRVGKYFKK